ncbi:MAG: aminopeptidase P family protein [Phycisphaerales bacterium]|nr:aminopeptidase P family protein [Phycisphaerales bacterium]
MPRASTTSEPPAPPSAIYAQRLSRLAALIAPTGLQALLVTQPKDVGYLTGFLGGDSYLLVPAEKAAPTLVSDFRYMEELAPVQNCGLARLHIRTRSMTDALVEVLGPAKEKVIWERVGVQAEHMTIAEKAAIGRKLGAGGSRRLTDTFGLVPRLRIIKDAHEVGLIRRAAKIQEQSLAAVLPTIKAGQTELEVAAAIECEMKKRGSSEPGFQTIVATGANSSLPHYRPSAKKIGANKPLLIDWGAVFKGYHSDMTRTFTLGKWPPKVREVYQIVLDAQRMAADALAPGKTTTEIDAVARKHIDSHGYAEFFGHGLGHGLGLLGHEEPRLTNMLAATRLEAGMVVTVEPGIYLPGVGGVRIEDDYVITERGAENLCSMSKRLEDCVL